MGNDCGGFYNLKECAKSDSSEFLKVVVVVVKMEVYESKVLQMRSDLTPEKIQQFMSALSTHANEHPGKTCLDLVIIRILITSRL